MVTCAVPGCNSSKNVNLYNHSFHVFPQNKHIQKQWLKMINREGWVPKRYSKVCSQHFEPHFFSARGKITRLRSDAIPTLCLPIEVKTARKVSPYVYIYRNVSPVPSGSDEDINIVDNCPKKKKMLKTIDVLKKRLQKKTKQVKNMNAQKKRLLVRARMAGLADALQTQGDGGQVSEVSDVSPDSPPAATAAIGAVEETKLNSDTPKADNGPVPIPEQAQVEQGPIEIKKEPEESQEPINEVVVESAALLHEEVDIKDEPIESEPEINNQHAQNNGVPNDSGDWQTRETELLKKIEELEKVKNERSEDGLKLELKLRDEEIEFLKARVKNLEMELQAALSKPTGKNHEIIENIKQQHEELLSKARGMIFDKTKMVKNQELQIEALTTQVQSLKDINVITKDLLEIRNSEVKAMEDRYQAMEAKFKAEKQRYDLVLQRAQTSTTINDDLRKEYETQLAIFKELREKYEQKVQALVAENNRLKEANLPKGGSSG